MFEKTLTDVVKGIRASKRDTALYISQCIAEIKEEINSTDIYIKANALQKITFLQMMGYNMSWASFASVEIMSSPRFAHKRIGYLAASQGFTQDTDVILLTTNLLKKELRGAIGGSMNGVYEAGLAINCISNIVTEDLARDLLPEVTNLTCHPQPYLRKKAVLCLFKIFVKYPQGLRLTFARVQQCLDDPNPSVVSCAVNVITELSDKNPKNYLPLAPAFFQLLTGSSNNWMLIKVVKLLGSLVAEEPRLARKLLDPLAEIVKTTQAKSLLYEAVHTITLSLPYCRKSDGTMPPSVPGIVNLCATTLRSFVEESDQNLKYLGLVGFASLMQSHPKVLKEPNYRPLILACLSDEDVTIRTRALDLLTGMASRKNLQELISQLVRHVELATGEYKMDLVEKICTMCSADKYALLQDFCWYLDILITLGHLRGIEAHADLLRLQITNVALRVLPVRSYAVRRGIEILFEKEGGSDTNKGKGEELHDLFATDNGRGKHIMPEILPAVAWIVGEYSDLIADAMQGADAWQVPSNSKGMYHGILLALLSPSNTQKLPTSTQSINVQAALKVFATGTANKKVSNSELEACVDTLTKYLPLYMESTDVEVQERAFTAHELLKSLDLVGSGVFGSDMPNLASVDNDDDSSSEEEGVVEDDLLGVSGDSSSKIVPKKKTKEPKTSFAPSSLATKCRNASPTLQYLLKPEPMKPISAKAQRKKNQAPIGFSVKDLEVPVDMSVFEDLLEEERTLKPGGGRISIESVSFTQQRPLRTVATGHPESAMTPPTLLENTSSELPSSTGQVNGGGGTSFSSFQHPPGGEMGALTQPSQQQQQLNRPPNQHDPFYLSSGGGDMANVERDHQGRFGTIQLLDSDAEDDNDKPRRKKKQKKRKPKKASELKIGDDDFAMLTSVASPAAQKPSAAAAVDYTVYSSDEGDQQSSPMVQRGSMTGRGKGAGKKEFDGLAKVDLTTPLREDEVMPKREHRVVPERPPESEPAAAATEGKKKKKKKKESKKKKHKDKSKGGATATAATTGDLLDFGGFASVAAVMQNASNPISTAFDDLLGLSAPSPTEMLPSATQQQSGSSHGFESLGFTPSQPSSSSKKQEKRPWMKATVKASSGSGSVNWNQVALYSRTYPHSEGTAAMIKVKVFNNMDNLALNDVAIKMKGHDSDIRIGNVAPGASAESISKAGPISYDGGSVDIRGTMLASDSSVSIKVTLPASLCLSPVSGLTQEAVMTELASGQWSSHSVTIGTFMDFKKIKPMLGSFLQAAEVEGEGSDSLSGTFAAAQQGSSTQVRALVKVKSSSVKVDLKCTDAALGKALSSNLKKLIL